MQYAFFVFHLLESKLINRKSDENYIHRHFQFNMILCKMESPSFIFSHMHATLYVTTLVRPLVDWLVGPLVKHCFFSIGLSDHPSVHPSVRRPHHEFENDALTS